MKRKPARVLPFQPPKPTPTPITAETQDGAGLSLQITVTLPDVIAQWRTVLEP